MSEIFGLRGVDITTINSKDFEILSKELLGAGGGKLDLCSSCKPHLQRHCVQRHNVHTNTI